MATQVRASTQINNDDHLLQLDGSTPMNAALNMDSNKVINVTDPTSPQDAATKAYVDGVAQGLDVKDSVRVATDSNINLAGGAPDTVDSVALASEDRILVNGQTTASENGIYIVSTVGTGSNGTWVRASDADEDIEVTAGLFTFVEEGTAYADTGWVLTSDNAITVGTTALNFAQFSGAGAITAGDGLTKSGATIDLVAADGSLTVNANSVGVNVDAALLKIDATDGVTFQDISAGQLYVGNGTGRPQAQSLSGDASLAATGALTVKTPGTVGTTQTLKSTGTGVQVADADSGEILVGQGASDTQFTAMTGDASLASSGALTVQTPGTSLTTQTIKSTGSGVKVGDGAAGDILIGQGTGVDTEFVTMSGDASISSTGIVTVASTIVKAGDLTYNEVPTGTINGTNAIFTTSNGFSDGEERVYLNGLRQQKTIDYTVTASNEITFTSAPLTGDVIVIDYLNA